MFCFGFRSIPILKHHAFLFGSIRCYEIPVKSGIQPTKKIYVSRLAAKLQVQRDPDSEHSQLPGLVPKFKIPRDPVAVTLDRFAGFMFTRQYLTSSKVDDGNVRYQFSNEFIDFLSSWCTAKTIEVNEGKIRAVNISESMARYLHSIKLTMKELELKRKRKSPPVKLLEELSRLYFLGIQKLVESKDSVTSEPVKINKILCQYADACCYFEYNPTYTFPDLWPVWYDLARVYLEEIDTDEKWQSGMKKKEDFNQAYAYLLSLIIDVTLTFRRPHEFSGLQEAWESRLTQYLANFKERNEYVISLRMATLAHRDGIKFKTIVAQTLARNGSQRSFAEYKYRIGFSEKPNRSRDEQMDTNLNG